MGHNYTSVITKPTCTNGGYTTYTCSRCYNSYTGNNTSATGHNYSSWQVRTAATCTANGTDYRTCGCGAEETRTTTALGQNYVSSVSTPTCTAQGYTTHTCSACGDSYVDSYVRANGHTPGEKADCTHDQICTTCGETLASASGHNYTEKVTAPTCTEQGYTTHTCSNCGDAYVDSYLPANSHTEGEWEIVIEATADKDGLMEKHCEACGTVLDSEVIPALNDGGESYTLGDVNADGIVDSVDYLLVKRACFNTYALSDDEKVRADINADKIIDSTDYLLVKRIAFGTYTVK